MPTLLSSVGNAHACRNERRRIVHRRGRHISRLHTHHPPPHPVRSPLTRRHSPCSSNPIAPLRLRFLLHCSPCWSRYRCLNTRTSQSLGKPRSMLSRSRTSKVDIRFVDIHLVLPASRPLALPCLRLHLRYRLSLEWGMGRSTKILRVLVVLLHRTHSPCCQCPYCQFPNCQC